MKGTHRLSLLIKTDAFLSEMSPRTFTKYELGLSTLMKLITFEAIRFVSYLKEKVTYY